jgi:hypothetical protein
MLLPEQALDLMENQPPRGELSTTTLADAEALQPDVDSETFPLVDAVGVLCQHSVRSYFVRIGNLLGGLFSREHKYKGE